MSDPAPPRSEARRHRIRVIRGVFAGLAGEAFKERGTSRYVIRLDDLAKGVYCVLPREAFEISPF